VRSKPRLALVMLAISAIAGCATYTDRLQQANRDTAAGNYGGAVEQMNDLLGVRSSDELPDFWSGDRPLAALERGSLQQAMTQFNGSSRDFSAAEEQLELLDLSSDSVGTLGSYLYSDSVKTYKTPPTERLSVNPINLMNYLAVDDLDGAAVEARRFQVMRDYLDSLNIKAEGPATVGTYLAGFVFEQRGEGDRALRYYEEALAGGGPLASLDDPIRRLARANPYRGPHLSTVLEQQKSPTRATPSQPELLVVLNLGRVPHKEPKRIPVGAAVGIAGSLASGNIDWLKYGAAKVVVYPELVSTPSSLGPPEVRVDGTPVALEQLTDLGAAIRKEYEQAKPKIVAAALSRMAARAAMTEGVRAGSKKQSNALATVLSLLFESTLVALDRPDTRSWTMLPDRVLVARLPVAAGEHSVEVAFGGSVARTVKVTVADPGYAAVVVTDPR
jgi:uncharacterized protein